MGEKSAGKGGEAKASGATIKTLREWAPWILAAGAFLTTLRELPVEQKALAATHESHKVSAALLHRDQEDKISDIKTRVKVLENDRTWIRGALLRIEHALPGANSRSHRNRHGAEKGSQGD